MDNTGKEILARYNRRMSLPLLGRFQNARWLWLNRELEKLGSPQSIADFGCLDGRLRSKLSYIPAHYYGIDSDPHDLFPSLALSDKSGEVKFIKAATPQQVDQQMPEVDVVAALEVMYYFEQQNLEHLLQVFKKKARRAVLITVLNETGPFFMARQIVKRTGLVERDALANSYSWNLIAKQTLAISQPEYRKSRFCFSALDLRNELSRVFPSVRSAGLPIGLPHQYDAFSAFVCSK